MYAAFFHVVTERDAMSPNQGVGGNDDSCGREETIPP